jgi:nucleoside-diphosphate-sugar epimerase
VLAAGRPGRAYNVGSATPVSILGLANAIAAETGVSVVVNGGRTNEARPAYVPDVTRIVAELGVRERVDLTEAIRRTMAWAVHPSGGHRSGYDS